MLIMNVTRAKHLAEIKNVHAVIDARIFNMGGFSLVKPYYLDTWLLPCIKIPIKSTTGQSGLRIR
ncbi:hypothetical protein ACFLTP_00880 [Chloroflexota bacterium]